MATLAISDLDRRQHWANLAKAEEAARVRFERAASDVLNNWYSPDGELSQFVIAAEVARQNLEKTREELTKFREVTSNG